MTNAAPLVTDFEARPGKRSDQEGVEHKVFHLDNGYTVSVLRGEVTSPEMPGLPESTRFTEGYDDGKYEVMLAERSPIANLIGMSDGFPISESEFYNTEYSVAVLTAQEVNDLIARVAALPSGGMK